MKLRQVENLYPQKQRTGMPLNSWLNDGLFYQGIVKFLNHCSNKR